MDPRRSGIPFYFSALHASAFASLSLLISIMNSLMWLAMSDSYTFWRVGSIPERCCVSMWCLCRKRSPSSSGAVGRGIANGNLSFPVFRFGATQIQSIIGQQSTYGPLLIMAPQRRVQASTGVRYRSSKSITKCAGS